MSNVTIHFDPEKADLLRRPLAYRLCGAAEDMTTPANDYYGQLNGLGEVENVSEATREAAERVRFILNLFDELGWELETKGKVDRVTVDAEWFRKLINDGFQEATDDIESGTTTEMLRTALEASEFYDALEAQLPPEPAKGKVVA